MLAQAGAAVHAVATTATERAGQADTAGYLAELGIEIQSLPGRQNGRLRPEIEFTDRGIHYHLLDVGPRAMHSWQKIVGPQFDKIFDHEIHTFRPDMLIAFGGLPGDVRRYERAKRQRVRIVFALRNEGYLNPAGRELLSMVDGILTPSRFLTNRYNAALGVDSTPLPLPMELDDVLAPDRDPIFFTMINPSPEKGLMVMARLAEELSLRRPDIPMMVIESRGSAGKLVTAGMAAGFDLRRHENIMMSPPQPKPKDIYLATRALLALSLWQEPAGRVAAEAILNGIPPLVSDRGGLPETCNGAGFYFPIPPEITPQRRRPVDREVIEPWIEIMERLEGDQELYREQSQRAVAASSIYRPENLTPRYVEYFRGILDS